jgi:hypothetical protein
MPTECPSADDAMIDSASLRILKEGNPCALPFGKTWCDTMQWTRSSWALFNGRLPFSAYVLLVSGRGGFETYSEGGGQRRACRRIDFRAVMSGSSDWRGR